MIALKNKKLIENSEIATLPKKEVAYINRFCC